LKLKYLGEAKECGITDGEVIFDATNWIFVSSGADRTKYYIFGKTAYAQRNFWTKYKESKFKNDREPKNSVVIFVEQPESMVRSRDDDDENVSTSPVTTKVSDLITSIEKTGKSKT